MRLDYVFLLIITIFFSVGKYVDLRKKKQIYYIFLHRYVPLRSHLLFLGLLHDLKLEIKGI